MSEQMEKNILKILEKVENLEEGQKNQEEFNNKVLERFDKQEEFNNKVLEKFDKQEEFNNKVLEKFDKQEEFNNKVLEKFSNQEEYNMRFLELNENMQIELLNLKNEVTKLSNNFTAFEFDINRKVDVLLENYDFDHKQFVKYNKDIFNLKKQSYNHEDRISNLELKAVMP